MMKTKALNNIAFLGVCCLVLIACEATEVLNPFDGPKVVLPACPTVKLLRDADKVTVYRAGPGQDITDILYEAKLTGLSGDCEYVGKDGVFQEVVISLRVEFDLVRDLPTLHELQCSNILWLFLNSSQRPKARDSLCGASSFRKDETT